MASVEERNRLHGFDNVRGLAAVAVVILHASYAAALFPLPGLVWPVPLDDPSPVADAVFWWLEASIMPLFFLLSGYFLARSLSRDAPMAVLSSRTKRLLFPMAAIGFAVLAIDLHVWVLGLITTGRATVSDYQRLKFPVEIQNELFGPAHLWYVEYLWLICAMVCIVAMLFRVAKPPSTTARTISAPLVACVFASLFALVAILLAYRPAVVLGFQHGWLPDAAKFGHGLLFVLTGMLLGRSTVLLESVRRFAPLSLALAVCLFALLLPRIRQTLAEGRSDEFDPLLGLLLAAFAFAATCGELGAGLRWLPGRNNQLAQLAEASFWIYIVHHPILGLLTVVLRPVAMPPLLRTGLVIAITLTLCLASYRWIVQGGLLERLLDGDLPWKALRSAESSATGPRGTAGSRRAA